MVNVKLNLQEELTNLFSKKKTSRAATRFRLSILIASSGAFHMSRLLFVFKYSSLLYCDLISFIAVGHYRSHAWLTSSVRIQ